MNSRESFGHLHERKKIRTAVMHSSAIFISIDILLTPILRTCVTQRFSLRLVFHPVCREVWDDAFASVQPKQTARTKKAQFLVEPARLLFSYYDCTSP